MDWVTLATAWGPAVPILAVLLKAHWDLVYKIMPSNFRLVTTAIERSEKSQEDMHKEHLADLRELRHCFQGEFLGRQKKAKASRNLKSRSSSRRKKPAGRASSFC